MKPIVSPDLTNEDPEYWEEVLKSHGLGEQDHPLLSTGAGDETISSSDIADLETKVYNEFKGWKNSWGDFPRLEENE